MRKTGTLAASALMTAGLYMLSSGGLGAFVYGVAAESAEAGRMKNVLVLVSPSPMPSPEAKSASAAGGTPAPAPTGIGLPASEDTAPFGTEVSLRDDSTLLETTIEGGMRIKNDTEYYADTSELLDAGVPFTLPADEAQILIIHTHSSEAYTQAGLDRYTASDTNRTEDTQFNIVRIGDELTEIFTKAGLNVIHDRGIYDYPSYTGSYTRSAEAIAQYLESCPGIRIVLDIHRDALGSEGVVYKTMAEEDGVCASQVMLLVGSDASGLPHDEWRGNLALALYLQGAVNSVYPTLMRPVNLVRERYNQQLSPGSLIIEVGSSGNTLQEALAAVRLFGRAAAPALLELVER